MHLNNLANTLLPAAVYERLASSDIARRLARGSFWSLVNALVMKSATLLQAIILARVLGITGFGEWGILSATIAMVSVLSSFGVGITATKHVAQWHKSEPERLGRLLGLLQIVAFTMGMTICLVLICGASPVARYLLKAPQLSDALVIVGFIVLLNSIAAVYVGILNGLERFRDSAIIQSTTTLCGTTLTIVLACYYGVSGAIVGIALTSLFYAGGFAVLAAVLLHRRGISLCAANPLSEWQGIRDFALPTAVSGAIVMVVIWVAQVALVQQPTGFDEMGAYQAANQWRTIIIFLPTQMLAAYLPVLASLIGDKLDKRHALQRRILLVLPAATFVISMPVILAAPWLMGIYGQKFLMFWPILAILALIPIFDIAHVVFQNSAIVHGYAWTLLISNLPMVVSVGFGVFWLIPTHLGIGLATTLLLGYSSRAVAEYFIFRLKTSAVACTKFLY